ncbi:MAG: hypothetical protein QOJ12_2802 [Thermoleophilales bacterium]|nr:hypothetical protein [Thermoleophilales bacterium]
MKQDDYLMAIIWHANPFRGDKFEDAWRPAAEAALRYGATEWLFLRSLDDPLDFTQLAVFPNGKSDFERYWYSEEISEYRIEASGSYQVPILPVFFRVAGAGELIPEALQP